MIEASKSKRHSATAWQPSIISHHKQCLHDTLGYPKKSLGENQQVYALETCSPLSTVLSTAASSPSESSSSVRIDCKSPLLGCSTSDRHSTNRSEKLLQNKYERILRRVGNSDTILQGKKTLQQSQQSKAEDSDAQCPDFPSSIGRHSSLQRAFKSSNGSFFPDLAIFKGSERSHDSTAAYIDEILGQDPNLERSSMETTDIFKGNYRTWNSPLSILNDFKRPSTLNSEIIHPQGANDVSAMTCRQSALVTSENHCITQVSDSSDDGVCQGSTSINRDASCVNESNLAERQKKLLIEVTATLSPPTLPLNHSLESESFVLSTKDSTFASEYCFESPEIEKPIVYPKEALAEHILAFIIQLARIYSHSSQPEEIDHKFKVFETMDESSAGIRIFVQQIAVSMSCSHSCYVLAGIYLSNLLKNKGGLRLSANNVVRLYFVALLLSVKYLDDSCFTDQYYSRICDHNISVKDLRIMETVFLNCINHNLYVDPGSFVAGEAIQATMIEETLASNLTLESIYISPRLPPSEVNFKNDILAANSLMYADSSNASRRTLPHGQFFATAPTSKRNATSLALVTDNSILSETCIKHRSRRTDLHNSIEWRGIRSFPVQYSNFHTSASLLPAPLPVVDHVVVVMPTMGYARPSDCEYVSIAPLVWLIPSLPTYAPLVRSRESTSVASHRPMPPFYGIESSINYSQSVFEQRLLAANQVRQRCSGSWWHSSQQTFQRPMHTSRC